MTLTCAETTRQPSGRRTQVWLCRPTRPGVLSRFRLGWPELSAANPRLVMMSISGFGQEGPERDRASYDMGAYWSRAGIANALAPDGGDIPYQRGGFGDHLTGMALAGGVAAALYARRGGGGGQLVSTSLLRAGMYQIGADLNALGRNREAIPFLEKRLAEYGDNRAGDVQRELDTARGEKGKKPKGAKGAGSGAIGLSAQRTSGGTDSFDTIGQFTGVGSSDRAGTPAVLRAADYYESPAG